MPVDLLTAENINNYGVIPIMFLCLAGLFFQTLKEHRSERASWFAMQDKKDERLHDVLKDLKDEIRSRK